MDEIQGTLARIMAREREEIAKLPCLPCVIDTDSARACKYYDRKGCKHEGELGERRRLTDRIESREKNLEHAGIAVGDIDEDVMLQRIVRDDLEPWTAVLAVRRALETEAIRFVVLGGDHQTGKTLGLHYACASSPDSVYISAQALGRLNPDMTRWIKAKILCVNELGREHLGNGYCASNIDELMAERQYGKKKTFFATNLPKTKTSPEDPLPSLFDRYGDLFASRIRKPVGAYVVCRAGLGNSAPLEATNPTPFNERAERDE